MSKMASDEGGLSLLETMISIVLLTVSFSISLPVGMRWWSHFGLEATTIRTLEDLRWCQSLAEKSDVSARTQFSTYSPEYWVYLGPTLLEHAAFDSSTNYVGGYLQAPFSRVQYEGLGGSQVSGVISLASGRDTASITLYMSSGLQVPAGVP